MQKSKEFLTAEEERELIAAAQDGKKEETQTLILKFMPLVRHVAMLKSPRGEYEDYVNTGVLGLYHALKKFNPAMGTRFATYANRWVSYYMQRLGDQPAFSEFIPAGYNEETDMVDPGHEELIGEEQEYNYLHEYIADNFDTLTPREQMVVELRIHGDLSGTELAAALGVSKQSAQQIESRTMSKIRKGMKRFILKQQHARRKRNVSTQNDVPSDQLPSSKVSPA
jgi:RNA polymerase sigma factor (sigma-70 family)